MASSNDGLRNATNLLLEQALEERLHTWGVVELAAQGIEFAFVDDERPTLELALGVIGGEADRELALLLTIVISEELQGGRVEASLDGRLLDDAATAWPRPLTREALVDLLSLLPDTEIEDVAGHLRQRYERGATRS